MIETLQNSPIFQSINPDEIRSIQDLIEIIELDSGEVLFEKGEPGEVVYTILEGLLKISLPDTSSGREKTVALLGEGEIVGEMATLGDQQRSGQARAVKDSRLIKIPEDQFKTLLEDYPQIGLNVIRILSRRLLMSDEEIQTVTFHTIPGRLAAQLLHLSEKFGVETENGIRIDIELTHKQLSDLVGTNRETITRYMNKLSDEQSIEVNDHFITIVDTEKLESWM